MRFTPAGKQFANNQVKTIHENYQLMVESEERTEQIVLDVLDNLKQNGHIIVLTKYIKHLSVLEQKIIIRIVEFIPSMGK